MSVEEKIKLNLKALTPLSNVEKVPEVLNSDVNPEVASLEVSSKIDSNESSAPIISNNKEEEIKPLVIAEKKDTRSHTISFADIKKQIDKKNDPTPKIEVAEVISEDINNSSKQDDSPLAVVEEVKIEDTHIENEIVSKIESDSVAVNDSTDTPAFTQWVSQDISSWETEIDKLPEEEIIKEDHAKNDKIALENIQKTKEILKKKEEKTEKKRSIFSLFSKRKWKKTKIDSKDTIKPGDLSQIKSEIKDDISETVSESKPVEKVHFSNYESHFKKESTNFLKRFQNFKYAPSTRVWLIMGLIGITILIISSLMVVFPEKHSMSIYKASILDMTSKSPEIIESESIVTPPVIIEEVIEIPEELEDDKINDDNSENSNENKTPITIEEKSKEKLRQHLFNKYK